MLNKCGFAAKIASSSERSIYQVLASGCPFQLFSFSDFSFSPSYSHPIWRPLFCSSSQACSGLK
jgi:hypothetical protein